MPATISEETFWSRCEIDETTNCWNWTMCRNACGYGTQMYKQKNWLAHRLAYFFKYGSVDDCVLHSCDNPACINIEHLRTGTHQENMVDVSIRKRQPAHRIDKCKRGHSLSGDNLITIKHRGYHGQRACRICARMLSRRFYWQDRLFNASNYLFESSNHLNQPKT